MIYTNMDSDKPRVDTRFVPLPEWIPCPFCVVGGMPYRDEKGEAQVNAHILELHDLTTPKR